MLSCHLPVLFRVQPFHLAHYEFMYAVAEVCLTETETGETGEEAVKSLVEWIGESGGDPDEDGFDYVAGQGKQKPKMGYVRAFYDPSEKKYSVSMTYLAWPAYAVDPVRFGTGWFVSLKEALQSVHRMYRWYRHGSVRPLPFFESYDEYRLSEQTVSLLADEMVFRNRAGESKN